MNERNEGMNEVHEHLLFEVQGDAFFRRERAQEYPEDGRNALAADAADRIAEYLGQLPPDDSRLTALSELDEIEGAFEGDLDLSALRSGTCHHRASRIGYQGGPPVEPSAWLNNYVEVIRGEVAHALQYHHVECVRTARDEGACEPETGVWNQPPGDAVQEAEEALAVLGLDDVPWCWVQRLAHRYA